MAEDVELEKRLELIEVRISRIAKRMCELHDEMTELKARVWLVETEA